MPEAMSYKIADHHRQREACLYVRQSSLHQVQELTESAERQYGLRQRAIALGWPDDRIRTIDDDQGKSGAHSANRSGFLDLMARIAAREVGIVLSLEVSRLCRNNTDWHQLLQIASITDTLILDESGVHDPNDANDSLLLGMKGALSAYELQGIRARLVGGQRSKAQRGELRMALPIGLVYKDDRSCDIYFDPDRAIVEAIELAFTTFRRLGSVMQTVKWFRKNSIPLPSRPSHMRGKVRWSAANHCQVGRIIHNPRYAGCYVYGRTSTRKRLDGTAQHTRVDRDSWSVCIPDAHVGFIDLAEYDRNQETLRKNKASFEPGQARQSAPREGGALLQSRVICGRCGYRMKVRYASVSPQGKQLARWYYVCERESVYHGSPTCQSMTGVNIDPAVSAFIVAAVNRENIALTLAVREQVHTDFAAVDQQHVNRIEALRHEADLSSRRYMEVDPHNRLVAATLETEWNIRLTALDQAIEEREKNNKNHTQLASTAQEERLLELSNDFSKVWNASATGNADRKRLLSLLVEDVTLTREGDQAIVALRLRGGRSWTLDPVDLPRTASSVKCRDASGEVLQELKELLDAGTSDKEATKELNRRGHKDSLGDRFTVRSIRVIRKRQGWPCATESHRDQLRQQGYLDVDQLAASLGISTAAARSRARRGAGVLVRRFKIGKRSCSMFKSISDDTDKAQ